MTDTNTLAPCPFCGERAETDFIPEHHSYQIECSDSIGCTARITRDSELGAIEAWNCRAALAAPAQAGEYPPSSADMVMAALDTEEWGLERMQRCDYLTDEGNREGAWLVKRQKAPYCAVYTDKPGEPYGPRSWSGPTALDALQKAADDLGIRLPQPAARGAAQAAPVDAESWLDLLAEARAALWQPANAALCERLDAFIDAARAARERNK